MTKSDLPHPFVSIIIPAYNEGRRLGPALEQIRRYAERAHLRGEVIVVDDGSTDATAEVARQGDSGPLRLRVLVNQTNRGKGYSVRRGMQEAAGELLLMTDADQSTPIWEIEKALPHLGAGYDVVIGSRDAPDSQISQAQPWYRRMLGWLLRFFRGRIMLKGIRDTQCGFKLFTRRAGKRIFAEARTDGFAFDCEALLLACKLGFRIKEIGVVWCNDADSRVRLLRDSVGMLLSILWIRWRLRRVRSAAAQDLAAAEPKADAKSEAQAET
jgi:dolichyl-phosphate beta-glucosyltransferase